MYLKLLGRKRKKLAEGDKTVIRKKKKREDQFWGETGRVHSWEWAEESWDLSILADPLSSIPH